MEILIAHNIDFKEPIPKKMGRPRKYTDEELRQKKNNYHLKYYHDKVKPVMYTCEHCGKQLTYTGLHKHRTINNNTCLATRYLKAMESERSSEEQVKLD